MIHTDDVCEQYSEESQTPRFFAAGRLSMIRAKVLKLVPNLALNAYKIRRRVGSYPHFIRLRRDSTSRTVAE
jgi:hypothetical protein